MDSAGSRNFTLTSKAIKNFQSLLIKDRQSIRETPDSYFSGHDVSSLTSHNFQCENETD
jgi:hypothetical protein